MNQENTTMILVFCLYVHMYLEERLFIVVKAAKNLLLPVVKHFNVECSSVLIKRLCALFEILDPSLLRIKVIPQHKFIIIDDPESFA